MKITEKDLTKLSTIRTKSYAKYFCITESINDIEDAIEFSSKNDLKLIVMGKGSNILFSKNRYDKTLFVKLDGGFDFFEVYDKFIEIGAAFSLKLAGKKLVEMGYEDYIFFNLIPASIGGAITQNAGIGDNNEIKDVCISVKLFDILDNRIVELKNKDCLFSYRNSIIKKEPGRFIVLSAKFNNRNKVSNINRIISLSRQKTQEKVNREPIGFSFGSTFKNDKKLLAWECINHIKGKLDSSKDIFYSNKHSNWIINNTSRTSGKDIVDLIRKTQRLVKEEFDIELENEVRII